MCTCYGSALAQVPCGVIFYDSPGGNYLGVCSFIPPRESVDSTDFS